MSLCPAGASIRASKQTRDPLGESVLALYLAAICDADERSLAARVLVMDVSMTKSQPVQPENTPGKQVVLDDASVDGPECRNDRVIAAVDQSLSLPGPSACEMRGRLGLDHVQGGREERSGR